MNHIQSLIQQMKDERFVLQLDYMKASDNRTHGPESTSQYATCPHCDRATVLIEHEFTPQLSLDAQQQRDETYFTCEWCNEEIQLGETNRRMPRKPASRAGWEDEMERARRMA